MSQKSDELSGGEEETTLSGDTHDPSIDASKYRDLQAAFNELQAENAKLKSQSSGSDAKEIIKGLSELINRKDKDKSGDTKPLAGPTLPQCFENLKPTVKTDNMGPPIADNIGFV